MSKATFISRCSSGDTGYLVGIPGMEECEVRIFQVLRRGNVIIKFEEDGGTHYVEVNTDTMFRQTHHDTLTSEYPCNEQSLTKFDSVVDQILDSQEWDE